MDNVDKLQIALKNIEEVMDTLNRDTVFYDWLRKSKNSLFVIITKLNESEIF